MKTKVEPTGKIFPASDRAGDVLAALLAIVRRSGCTIGLRRARASQSRRTPAACELSRPSGRLMAESVVVTTGGKSYPSSGSTGDGYAWAAELGHTIVPPRPALVPIASDAAWLRELQGITLEDVRLTVIDADDANADGLHALLNGAVHFCLRHFGVTGPAALDVSRAVSGIAQPRACCVRCDLLLELQSRRLWRPKSSNYCQQVGGRLAASVIARYVPQRLAETIATLSGIARDRRTAEVSRPERQRLAAALKQFDIPVSGTLGFNKAEVTAGGVA